jgi:hypothetical protein
VTEAGEHEFVTLRVPGAVEKDGVDVWVESQVGGRALQDGDGARLRATVPFLPRSVRIETLHRLLEDPGERAEHSAVPGESRPQAKGNVSTHCRRPLSGGNTDSMRLAAVAHMRRPRQDGQKPLPLQLNATIRLSPHPTPEPCKAPPARYAAAEIGLEFPASMLRNPHLESTGRDRAVKRLKVVAHNRVQKGSLAHWLTGSRVRGFAGLGLYAGAGRRYTLRAGPTGQIVIRIVRVLEEVRT